MKSFKRLWRSFLVLLVLVGLTFLFNLPGLVRCGAGIEPKNKSEYSSIDGEPIIEVGLAQASE